MCSGATLPPARKSSTAESTDRAGVSEDFSCLEFGNPVRPAIRPPPTAGCPPSDEATANDSRERRLTVSDGQQTYAVEATQTHRPGSYSMEPKLEWQFYIE